MPITKKMPSTMLPGHNFARVPGVALPRSVFNMSRAYKTTFDAGNLIPIFLQEVLPGDSFHVVMSAFARLTTPIKPLMDNLRLFSWFFFVPWRLTWANFVKFMGEQDNPGDSISFTIPTFSVPFTPAIGSLADYFGALPQATTTQVQTPNAINCLVNRAFWLIYNKWFRDENLISSRNGVGGTGPVGIGDGPDVATDWLGAAQVPKHAKRPDYFTMALPFVQKGTASSIPLTGLAVVKTQSVDNFTGAQQALHVLATGGGSTGAFGFGASAGGLASFNATAFTPSGQWYPSNLAADLSTVAAAFTINDMRQAIAIQQLLERDARGGTRYTELVEAHWGVRNPDARLQRPEFLGGGGSDIDISPIAQTTQTGLTGGSTPLGNLGGYGTVSAQGHGFHKAFTEHGIIIGIISVGADITYQQGLDRMWTRRTRFDFYWNEFAHIGEQSVLSQELFWDGTTAGNAADVGVFGYVPRYEEYRYGKSMITGLYRSNAAGTLEIWHLSEKFASRPTLGQTFIEDQTTTVLSTRVATPSEPDFYLDAYFKVLGARVMPTFGVPGLRAML